MKGIWGRLLDIDLTSGRTGEIAIPEKTAVKYLGGRGLGARLLFDLLPANIDPLSADNILIFLTGPFTGSMVPGSSKFVVVTKSPLTGGWCDSYSSGKISLEIKKAGYDGLVIRGRANHPCYLQIDDGGVEIRDAGRIWGMDSFQAEKTLKELEGNASAGVSSIGPAGEKLCSYACINSDFYRQAARGGVGTVMGHKRLKAIVAKGSSHCEFHNRKKVIELNRANYERAKVSQVFQARSKYGTPLTLNFTLTGGILPTRNFQFGTWEKALGKIDSVGVYKSAKSHRSCQSCFVHCSLITEVDEGKYKGTTLEGPEYETLGMFGSNLLIDSLPTIIQANVLCDKLGLDTISAGNVIGFAMECFEKGIISEREVGFPLSWGSGQAAVKLIEQMALHEGFGAVLADGSMRASQKIGQGSEEFAIHVMGQDLPMHDPRLEPGLGLVYIADATPGRHNQANSFIPPEGLEIGFQKEVGDQVGRGRYLKILSNLFHVLQASGACQFGLLSTTFEYLHESLSAVTGHPFSFQEVLDCGERIATIRQAFNIREGINFLGYQIPWRAYGNPPLESGPLKNVTVKIDMLLQEYLEEMGWSKDAATPHKRRLHELGLDFLANHLYQEG